MRQLNFALASHLRGGATSLCHCWKLLCRDGSVLAFTDHDADVVFNGITYAAKTGLDGSKIDSALGFSVGGMEIAGAFDAASLTADDLVNGRYDDATIEFWWVNWADVTQNLLLDMGSIGQVKRGEYAFTAELRGLAHLFDQETGRLFQKSCSADLGDARCSVVLAQSGYSGQDTIASTDGKTRFAATLGGFADGWFTNGRLTFSSGANAGAEVGVKTDSLSNGQHQIEIWTPLARALGPGDAFAIVAGCSKTFAACRTKFSNTLNFRGFPHMPGNDVAFSYATSVDAALDGGSMNQ